MSNTLLSLFVIAVLFLPCLNRTRAWYGLLGLSILAIAQVSPKTGYAVAVLLMLHGLLVRVFNRFRPGRFVPLLYVATLLLIHHFAKLNIPGFSYIVLSSSLDLFRRIESGVDSGLGNRLFNLCSFPKIIVGPITAADSHLVAPSWPVQRVALVALIGLLKAFVLVNLWRQLLPAPIWSNLSSPMDFLWFGLWNYVHLYLEFSGVCDLVAALFWLLGFGCPLNFAQPYLALSVTDFWKRWHITLGDWLRTYVYFPLGGSRVGRMRVGCNLVLVMVLSGAWHGIRPSFLLWGLLQGVFLVIEREFKIEARLESAAGPTRVFYWVITQFLVICSWILFFAPL